MTSTPEQREWQDKWIAALRSGKYKQTNSVLVVEYGDDHKAYCCLGVAVEIAKDVTGEDLGLRKAIGFSGTALSGWKVRELFGFISPSGDFSEGVPNPNFDHATADEDDEPDENVNSFVEANDEANLTFEQIADLAETYRDKVFV